MSKILSNRMDNSQNRRLDHALTSLSSVEPMATVVSVRRIKHNGERSLGNHHRGILGNVPKVGNCLTVWIDDYRLRTSEIVRVFEQDNLVYVETINSVYRLTIEWVIGTWEE